MTRKQKLELTWVGKEQRPRLEPRILLEEPGLSHHAATRGEGVSFDNRLIQGDNLLALKALEADFAGQVKCVFIDPPYNTGSAFEHYDDGLEHSLWLGMMRDRLELIRTLLAPDGVFWSAIDDTEQAHLKLLCDETFGRENFVALIPTIMNLKGNQGQSGIVGTHEYLLLYCKNKDKFSLGSFPVDEEALLQDWQEDDIGLFKPGATLKATGEDAKRERRPRMFYPLLVDRQNSAVSTIKDAEFEQLYDRVSKTFDDAKLDELRRIYEPRHHFVLPVGPDGSYSRWRWGWNDEMKSRLATDVIVNRTRNGVALYKKQRPELGELPVRRPKSIFYKPEYSSGNGTAQVRAVLGDLSFDYPKPEQLLHDVIYLSTKPGDLVLDSFAGSGTTGAVAHKMGRQWIMVELGEHARTHIVPRLRKVIDGEDPGGVTQATGWAGGGSFRFYRLAPSLIEYDKWGREVISRAYDPAMLAEALCKLEGFTYAPSETEYWNHGASTERDFIYVTTQTLTHEQLRDLSEQVGEGRSLLVLCAAYRGDARGLPNLTVKKIPDHVRDRCDWGRENYSLEMVPAAGEGGEDGSRDGATARREEQRT